MGIPSPKGHMHEHAHVKLLFNNIAYDCLILILNLYCSFDITILLFKYDICNPLQKKKIPTYLSSPPTLDRPTSNKHFFKGGLKGSEVSLHVGNVISWEIRQVHFFIKMLTVITEYTTIFCIIGRRKRTP